MPPTPISPSSQRRSPQVHFEQLEPRILFDAVPDVSVTVGDLTVAEDQLVNDDIQINIQFDNTGDQVGFAPYIDIVAPAEMQINSIDLFGTPQSNPNGPASVPIGEIGADGQLIEVGTAGSPVPVNHPMFESSVGVPPSDYFGGAGSGTTPVTYDVTGNPDLIGQMVYSVALPFGSYSQDNPALNLTLSATLNTADGVLPNQNYGITAQGGFALGHDGLDNPGTVASPTDAPLFGNQDSADVVPLIMQMTKSAGVPEDGLFPYSGELASGPNHPVTYTLSIDVANGETVTGLNLTDVLPGDLAYLGNLMVEDSSGNPLAYTLNAEPFVNTDGLTGTPDADNLLDLTFASVTGVDGTDIVVTYEAFIPHVDGETGAFVVNPVGGEEVDLAPYNDAQITGTWNGSPVSDNEGPEGVSQDGVTGGLETDYVLEEHSLAIQKAGVNIDDRNAPGFSPDDILEYTMNFQVSDYFAFDNLLVDDLLGDAQDFLPGDGRVGFLTDPSDIIPQLTFTQHGQTITVDFDSANYTAVVNPNGTTSIQFDVYSQLQADHPLISDPLTGTLTMSGVSIDGETVMIDGRTYYVSSGQTTVPAGNVAIDISADGTKAEGTLTMDTQPTPGDTVTIGATTYTWRADGTSDEAGEIDVGADLAEAKINFVAAVNGTDANNTANGQASAAAFSGDDSVITALYTGTQGDAIVSAETFTAVTNIFDAATLGTTTAGADATAAETVAAVVAAITGDASAAVTAAVGAGDTVDLTSSVPYAPVTTTETMANGSFGGGTLSGGDPILGGLVPSGGIGAGSLDPATFNMGATTGTITYRVQVRNSNTVVPGEPEISQGDLLENTATISGDNLNIDDLTSHGTTVSDGSSSSLGLPTGSITKEVAAITSHGSTTFNPTNFNVAAGDLISYRIQYELPLSEFEQLRFEDFLPLPIFDVASIDDTQVYDFDAGTAYTTAGRISFGADDTFFGSEGADETGDGGIDDDAAYPTLLGFDPTIDTTTLGSSNGFIINVGDYEVGTNPALPTTIEFIVTVEIQDGEYADGLLFTNQVGAFESNSFLLASSNNQIAQIDLVEPELNIVKGVVATTHPTGVFDSATGPAGVTFNAPGSGNAFTGNITSDGLAVQAIDANLSAIDAADVVTFVITVENTGTSQYGAFDVSIIDTIPPGFQIPGVGGLNLRVTDGNGNALATSGDLFGAGLVFSDPSVSQGSLTQFDGASGTNIAIIAYDLEVAGTVSSLETLTNTAEILNYSHREAGTDHASPGEHTDQATVITVVPDVDKSVISTSHNTTANDDTEAVIGEIITYEVTITIPEGELDNVHIIDQMDNGLAFVDFLGVTSVSSGLSSDLGALNSATAIVTDPGTGQDNGNLIELGFGVVPGLGTVTNSNTNNAVPETITFQYRAVVLNHSGNDEGDTRNNLVDLNWDVSGNTESVTDQAEDITIREADLDVTKAVSNPNAETDETITYTFTVTNNGTVEAYEAAFSDVLPAEIKNATNLQYISGEALTTLSLDAGGPEGTINATWLTLGVGLSTTFSIDVTVDTGLDVSTLVSNTANVNWTSLPGDPGVVSTHNQYSEERSGDTTDPNFDPQNDYGESASVDFIVPTPQGNKAIVDTSEGHTSNDNSAAGVVNAAPGEVIRYEVTIDLPQGNMANLSLVDTLEAGLLFLDPAANNVTVQINGFAADGSTYVAPNLPGNVHTGQQTLDPGRITIAGQVVTLDLGQFTNNETDAGTAESLTIAYNVIVSNDDGTNVFRGNDLSNSAQVQVNGISSGTPATVDTNVVQPQLTIVKSDSGLTSADAGDVISYTLTVTADSNADAATAFDLAITDSLPAELEIVGGTLAFSGLPVYVVTSNVNFVGQDITAFVDQLQPGDTFDIVFDATVRDTGGDQIGAGEIVNNTANLTYSSLPGTGTADGTGDNNTGSVADTPGTVDGERIYTGTDSDAFTSPSPIITKVLDNPADTTYTIGEIVDYVLTVTVPEGETANLVVNDLLEAGLSYVSGSLAVTPGAGISIATAGPYDDTNVAFFSQNDPGATSNESFALDFGAVDFNDASAGDGLATQTIEVRYQAIVDNIVENQDSVVRSNVASINWTDGNGVNRNTADSTGNADTDVSIVEPDLDVTKTISNDVSGLDAGDTVTYQIVVEHSGLSSADAFELALTDQLPDTVLENFLLVSADIGASSVLGSFTIDGSNQLVTTGDVDLAQSEVLTIVVSGQVRDDASPGDAVNNTANLTWTGIDGINAAERDGSDGEPGPLNNYADSGSANTQVQGLLDITKTIPSAATEVLIDGTIPYQLEISVAEGILQNLTIVDTLPDNVTLSSNPVISNANGMTINGFSFVQVGQQLTITATSVENPSDSNNPAAVNGDSFFITYEVTVDDVAPNFNTVVLTNDADASADNVPDDDDNQASITIIEPVLEFQKTLIGTDTGDAGDVFEYTFTINHHATSQADAQDIILNDVIPAGFQLVPGSITPAVGTPAPDSTVISGTGTGLAGETITLRWETIPETVTSANPYEVSIQFVLVDTITDLDADIVNSATLDYDQNPDDSDGRSATTLTANADPVDPDLAYGFTKDVIATSETSTGAGEYNPLLEDLIIGEEVTFQLVATFGEGTTTGVVITDTLPFTALNGDANGVLEYISSEITAIGAGITNSNGLIVSSTGSQTGTDPDVVTFDFGDIVATGNNVADSTITIEVVARVQNLAQNQDGDLLTNTGQLSIYGGTQTFQDTADVEVVEPDLDISTTITTDTTGLDAGDTVTYQIQITNPSATSTADAFELNVSDVLPDGFLEGFTLDSATIGASDVIGSFNITIGNDLETTGNVDLLLDEVLTITITGIIRDDVSPADIIANTADVTWTSIDDGNVNERGGTDGVGGALNDYADSGNINATVQGLLDITKTIPSGETEVLIDGTIAYQLEVSVAEGILQNLTIVDTLPDNVTLSSNPVIVNPNGLVINGFSFAQVGQQLTITATSVENPSDSNNPAAVNGDSFFITYEVTVDDVAPNFNTVVLTNDADASADDVPDDNDNQASITIIEPVLEFQKALIGTDTGDAGDVFEYTFTINHHTTSQADAQDIILNDVIPAGFQLVPGSITPAVGTPAPDSTVISGTGTGLAGETITLRWETIPETVTSANPYEVSIQFALVDTITDLDANIVNSATLDYDQNPDDSDGRSATTLIANADPVDPDLAYGFTKDVISTSETSTGTGEHNPLLEDLIIGEEVTFQLVATFGEGTTTGVVITDTLPFTALNGDADGVLEYISSEITAIGAGVTNSNGLIVSSTGSQTGTDPDVVSFNFGDIVATGNNVADSTITIEVVARVQNLAQNQDGDLLTNTGELSIYGGAQTFQDTADVEVVEPDLAIATTITTNTTGLDAGDTVTYQIQITNPSATSAADAFDLNVSDVLPDGFLEGFTLDSATIGAADVIGSFNITAGNDLETTGNVDLLLDEVLTITITGTIRDDVSPADIIANTADVTWTSIDDGNVNERGGTDGVGGALNDYADSGNVNATVQGLLDITKTIPSGETEVLIDGTIAYQLEVSVAEGILQNLTIVDTLPDNVTLSSNPVISNANGMTINGFSFVQVGQQLTITATSVENPSDSNNPAAVNGDSFFITYEVTVDDVAPNFNTVVLTNDADASADDVLDDLDNQASITIAEPVLEIQKTLNGTDTGDAGDVFDYTFTINHDATSGADGFDVILNDVIPAGFQFVPGSITPAVGTPAPDSTVITGTGDAGDTITLRWETIPDTVTSANPYEVSIQFVLVDTITDLDANIVNSATLDYDQNPDDSDGRSAPTLTANADPVDPDLAYGFTKDVISTSETSTGAGEHNLLLEDLVIGEEVTFQLVATFGEGTTTGVVITDNLPWTALNGDADGVLEYVSSEITAIGGGITNSNGLIVTSTGSLSGINSDVVSFNFGDIVATGNNVADSTITIEVVARVQNLAQNQDGDLLTNTGELSIYGGAQTFQDSAQVEVVEPDLAIATTITTNTTGLDAGDTVTYQIQITNPSATSTADAFDINVTDVLPDGFLEGFTLDSATIGATNVVAAFNITAGNDLETIGNVDLLLDEVLTITITGTIRDDASPADIIANTADVTWTSINDGNVNERGGADGVGGALNDYADSSNVNATVQGVLNLTKTIPAGTTEVAVGDTITYRLEVEVAEGELNNLTIVDTLPNGVTLDLPSVVISNANGMTVAGFNASQLGQVLTITTTSVTNPGNVDDDTTVDTDSFFITYDVVVSDDPANVNDGDTLTNDADASADDVPDDIDNQVSVTVIEPVMQFTKDLDPASPTTGDAGDVFTYILTFSHDAASTADAFDVEISDLIPAGFQFVGITELGATPAPDNTTISGTGVGVAGETVTLRWETIPETVNAGSPYQVEIQFELVDTITDLDADIINSATLDYDSHEDDTLGRAGTSITDSADPIDPDLAYAFTKDVIATSETSTGTGEHNLLLQDLVVGEEVTFQLVATFGEGTTTGVVITDNLPWTALNGDTDGVLEYVSSEITAIGGGITNSNGLIVTSTGSLSGINSDVVSFNFGDIVATGNNVADSTITIEVVARVQNLAQNQDGDLLTNTGELSIYGGAQTFQDSAQVEVVEPDLAIATTITTNTTGLDAGDTVTYQIQITNPSATSTADAFDINVSDVLPDGFLEGFTLDSATIGATNVVAAFNITAGNDLETTGNVDLLLDEVLTITITGTIRDDASPADIIANTADVTWTSINDGNVNERGGADGAGGALNDYADSSNVNETVQGVLNLTKTIPAGTTEVAVGDTITYRLEVEVAEGELNNLTIVDTLPNGVTLDLPSVVISNANGMTVAGFNASQLGQVLTITTTSVTNPGNVDDDTTVDTDSFFITYDVVVSDDPANVNDGDTLTNDADASADDVPDDIDNQVSVTVIEPVMQFTKDLDPASPITGDAGDVFTYILTFSHDAASTADAFDVEVTDVIPAGFQFVGITELGATPAPDNTTISGTGVGVAGETITLRWETVPETVNAGSPYQVEIQFELVDTITDLDADIINSATLDYDSHEDDTLGRAGTSITDSADPIDPDLAYAFTKDVIATSETSTGTGEYNPLLEDLVIGEEVTFQLVATFGEGTTTGVIITDTLPFTALNGDADGVLEYISSEITAIGTGITSISNGLVVSSTGSQTGTDPDVVTFNFGDIVATGNNVADSTITIEVVARVQNVLPNQGGDLLTNTGELSIYGGAQTFQDTADVEVVEPDLDISTTITTNTTGLDAGDTVTYQIQITNPSATSTADAFDINVSDVLPDGFLEGFTLDSATIGATDLSGSFNITIGNDLETTGNVDLLLDEVLTITITGTIRDDASPADIIANTADVTWTGINDGNVNERGGADGVGGALNDYADSSNVNATVQGVLNLTKTIPAGTTEVAVGDTITYRLEVEVAEGELNNLTIVDTLPNGVTLDLPSVVISNANGMTVAGFNASQLGQVLTITTTSVTNPGNVDDDTTVDTDSFFITYDVVVSDDPANVNDGDTLTNDADASADDVPDDIDNQVSVTVIEPVMQFTKDLDPASPITGDAGDVFTYILTFSHDAASTADAFDVEVTDVIPAGFQFVGITELGATPAPDNTTISGTGVGVAGETVTLRWETVPETVNAGSPYQVEIQFELVDTITDLDADIINSATLDYDSHEDDTLGRAGTSITDSADPIDPDLAYAFTKDVIATSETSTGTGEYNPLLEDLVIGEEVTFQLVATFGEGTTTGVIITDTLPFTALNGDADGVLEYISSEITAIGTGITSISNGLVVSSTGSQTGTDPDVVTFNFGDIVATGNNVADSTITIEVVARVQNVVPNQGGDLLTNTGELSIYGGAQTFQDTAQVEVVEPDLDISTTITTDTTGLDAGDTVTYQIQITNPSATSTADAFDINVTDVLPDGFLEGFTLDSATIGATDLSGSFNITIGNDLETTGNVDLLLDEVLTITITGTIRDDASPADIIANTADVTWTSINDGNVNERGGADGVGGALNDYADSSNVSATVQGVLDVTKSIPAGTTEVAVGDTVTYQLEVEVAEGELTNLRIIDTLPDGMTLNLASVQVSNANGMTIAGFNAALAGQILTVDATSVTNPGNADDSANTDTDSFFITYDAQVDDDPINAVNAATLTNDADATADDVPDDIDNQTTVTVIEPVMTFTKALDVASPTSGDAGDVFTYIFTVNHNAASTADAFDVEISDLIPAGFQLVGITELGTTPAPDSITISGTTVGVAGETITLRWETIPEAVNAGDPYEVQIQFELVDTITDLDPNIINGATLDYDSHEDDALGRAGTPIISNAGPVDPDLAYAFTKGVIATSQNGDSAAQGNVLLQDLVVGEEVTFELVATFGEGTTNGVVITDTLPFTALNGDGDGVLEFVSSQITAIGGGITSISNGLIVGSNGVQTGADPDVITFDFGNIVAEGNNVADSTITIQVVALVQNVAQNQDGDLLTNTGELSIYSGAQTFSDTAEIEIFEPEIVSTKTITSIPADPDAGDTVSYEITISNSTAFDAFDSTFADALPAEVALQPATFLATSNQSGVVTSDYTATASGVVSNAPFTLAAGETITFSYDATITGAVVDGQTYTNDVQVDWTSISGVNANERTGDDGEGGGTDDYEDNSSASFVTEVSNTFAFDKIFISGNAPHTDVAEGTDVTIPDLVVGEIVTYELVATIGNGTTTNVNLVDQLDLANGLLHIQSATVVGGSSLTSDQGVITGITATISNSNGDAYNDRIDLNLGTMVNSGVSGVPADNQVVITVEALVVNDTANQDGDVIRNTGQLNYDSAGGPLTLSDFEDVEIVEPDLNVVKTLTSVGGNVDSGDTISWQITIEHTGDSTADAMDLVFSDFIPSGVTVDFATGVTVTETGPTDIKGNFELVAGELRTIAGGYDLVLGNSITIDITGALNNTVEPNQVIQNTANIDWTSLDGIDTNERGGDGTGPNDYNDTDSAAAATVIEELGLDKRLPVGAETSYTIGEIVTFELEVTIMEGTTPQLLLQDRLPTGLRYVTGSATVDAGQSNPLIAIGGIAETWNPGTGLLTLSLGDVVNSSVNDGADDSFVITYQTVVENIATNQGGISLTNDATADAEDVNDNPLPQAQDDETISLIEPVLDIEKTVDDNQPKLGQTLTYTLTITNTGVFPADSFDIDVTDNLPAGLTLDSASVSLNVLGAPANPTSMTANSSTPSALMVILDRLDIGESVEIVFEADVTSATASFDAVITNTAGLEWTSTTGPNPDERTGDPSDPGGPLNDYNDNDDVTVEVFQPDLQINKTDGNLNITPGSNITYTLTVTNIGRAEALDVQISDDLSEYFANGFTLVSTSPAGSLAGNVLTVDLPDMVIDGVEIVTITLLAPDTIPAGLESIVNTAQVTHQDIDPTPTNNKDNEESPVIAVPDLVVTKTDGRDSARAGEPVTYTLTYTNEGDQVAGGVVLTDTLPPFTEFVSTTGGGRYVGGNVVWNLGEVDPGETGTLVVTVKIWNGLEALNTATISDDGLSGRDPTPKNNVDTDTTGILFPPVSFPSYGIDVPSFTDYFRIGENIHHRLPTAIGHHMNSGLVQPGSTVVLEVYNKLGQRIARSQTVADTGGNWVITFQTATIEEEPHRIVMRQTAAVHNDSDATGFNFRTYFGPAFNTGTQYVTELTQKEIFTLRSAESVVDLYESSASIIRLQWNAFEYEFFSSSGLLGVVAG